MKRIGIECRSIEDKNNLWGVGKIILGLIKELSRRPELEKNFRFVLYFKDTVPDYDFLNAPIFEKKTVPVPFFKGRMFPIYYFAFLPIRLLFERLDWMFWPNYMLPIIALNKSVVMLTEDVYYETHDNPPTGGLPFRYRLAYGIFVWWTAKFATKIMAISETSKKNIAGLYKINPARIFVNHLGIEFHESATRRPEKLRHGASPPQAASYLLFVGQMFPRRHAKETLSAFEQILPDFPELNFVMIGPDKYPAPIIDSLIGNMNKRLGREAVIHKNHVNSEELADLYLNAKALIYVSAREAFGLPPMEALSHGIPPIIADNELGHELFGDYAVYARGASSTDICEAIRQALTDSDKIKRIKYAGPEFVKKYSWKDFTDKILAVFRTYETYAVKK